MVEGALVGQHTNGHTSLRPAGTLSAPLFLGVGIAYIVWPQF